MKQRTSPTSASQVIDAYIRDVTKRLTGPRRARRHLADEVRDHLHEAAGTIGNPDPIEAASAVVSQFGEPQIVAERLQPGLSRRHTPGVALGVFITSAGVSALWLGVLLSGPHEPWIESAEPKGLAWADAAGSLAMKAALAAAALAFVFGWLLPRIGQGLHLDELGGRLAARLAGIGVGALAVSVAAILGYVALRGYLAPKSLEWSDVLFGTVVSLVAVVALTHRARGTVLAR